MRRKSENKRNSRTGDVEAAKSKEIIPYEYGYKKALNSEKPKCNFECWEPPKVNSDGRLEFIAPVKISMKEIDPSIVRRRTWMSGFLVLSYIVLGIQFMSVTMYSYLSIDAFILHVPLYTTVYQVMIPVGIISHNPYNGVYHVQRTKERIREHGVIMSISFVLSAFVGKYLVWGVMVDEQQSLHHMTGEISNLLIWFSIISSPAMIFRVLPFTGNALIVLRLFHRAIGILFIITSTICFWTGLMKAGFMSWLPRQSSLSYSHGLICGSIFVATVIVVYPAFHLFKKTRKIVNENRFQDIIYDEEKEALSKTSEFSITQSPPSVQSSAPTCFRDRVGEAYNNFQGKCRSIILPQISRFCGTKYRNESHKNQSSNENLDPENQNLYGPIKNQEKCRSVLLPKIYRFCGRKYISEDQQDRYGEQQKSEIRQNDCRSVVLPEMYRFCGKKFVEENEQNQSSNENFNPNENQDSYGRRQQSPVTSQEKCRSVLLPKIYSFCGRKYIDDNQHGQPANKNSNPYESQDPYGGQQSPSIRQEKCRSVLLPKIYQFCGRKYTIQNQQNQPPNDNLNSYENQDPYGRQQSFQDKCRSVLLPKMYRFCGTEYMGENKQDQPSNENFDPYENQDLYRRQLSFQDKCRSVLLPRIYRFCGREYMGENQHNQPSNENFNPYGNQNPYDGQHRSISQEKCRSVLLPKIYRFCGRKYGSENQQNQPLNENLSSYENLEPYPEQPNANKNQESCRSVLLPKIYRFCGRNYMNKKQQNYSSNEISNLYRHQQRSNENDNSNYRITKHRQYPNTNEFMDSHSKHLVVKPKSRKTFKCFDCKKKKIKDRQYSFYNENQDRLGNNKNRKRKIKCSKCKTKNEEDNENSNKNQIAFDKPQNRKKKLKTKTKDQQYPYLDEKDNSYENRIKNENKYNYDKRNSKKYVKGMCGALRPKIYRYWGLQYTEGNQNPYPSQYKNHNKNDYQYGDQQRTVGEIYPVPRKVKTAYKNDQDKCRAVTLPQISRFCGKKYMNEEQTNPHSTENMNPNLYGEQYNTKRNVLEKCRAVILPKSYRFCGNKYGSEKQQDPYPESRKTYYNEEREYENSYPYDNKQSKKRRYN